jgi:hypothetical protein
VRLAERFQPGVKTVRGQQRVELDVKRMTGRTGQLGRRHPQLRLPFDRTLSQSHTRLPCELKIKKLKMTRDDLSRHCVDYRNSVKRDFFSRLLYAESESWQFAIIHPP